MTAQDVGMLISQYGFPIVACCALFWQNNQQDKRHREEAENWTKALAANTAAIERLEITLGKIDDRAN